ncbi:MAG: hypothetical protein J0L97_07480 [Alphaproteobacteria bacterium]|nr:hypothetical protein [Alphaproteobacteria bacterium]
MPFFDAIRHLLARLYAPESSSLDLDPDIVDMMETVPWCAVKAQMSEARSGNYDILRIWFSHEITPELVGHLNGFFEDYNLASRVLTISEPALFRKGKEISYMEVRGQHMDDRLPSLRNYLQKLGISFDVEVNDCRHVHYHPGTYLGYDEGRASGFGSSMPRH